MRAGECARFLTEKAGQARMDVSLSRIGAYDAIDVQRTARSLSSPSGVPAGLWSRLGTTKTASKASDMTASVIHLSCHDHFPSRLRLCRIWVYAKERSRFNLPKLRGGCFPGLERGISRPTCGRGLSPSLSSCSYRVQVQVPESAIIQ